MYVGVKELAGVGLLVGWKELLLDLMIAACVAALVVAEFVASFFNRL